MVERQPHASMSSRNDQMKARVKHKRKSGQPEYGADDIESCPRFVARSEDPDGQITGYDQPKLT